MIANAIARPSTTPESAALITPKIQTARLRGRRGRSAHRVGELTNEWGDEGGVRLMDDRNCHRAVKHHNLKRCTHHIEFEMAARVDAVWNSERVVRVIATYWSKSLRREMDRSEAVRGFTCEWQPERQPERQFSTGPSPCEGRWTGL